MASIVNDPADSAFDLVTIRVPKGCVPCAETLSKNVASSHEMVQRSQLMAKLRSVPIESLQKLAEANL